MLRYEKGRSFGRFKIDKYFTATIEAGGGMESEYHEVEFCMTKEEVKALINKLEALLLLEEGQNDAEEDL